MGHHIKARIGWCVYTRRRNELHLRRRTLLCQKLPADFEEKLFAFQQHVIGLKKKSLLSQTENANETPVYFDMQSNYIVGDSGTKSVVINALGYEKMHVTVILVVLADGSG
jgi:hypothetical protein